MIGYITNSKAYIGIYKRHSMTAMGNQESRESASEEDEDKDIPEKPVKKTTIQLTRDVREKLKSLGIKGESYNDVLQRLIHNHTEDSTESTEE